MMKTILLVAVTTLASPGLTGQTADQKTFASSKQAVDTLIQTLRSDNTTALQSILGPGSEAIISSGDDVADKTARINFLAKYDTKHS